MRKPSGDSVVETLLEVQTVPWKCLGCGALLGAVVAGAMVYLLFRPGAAESEAKKFDPDMYTSQEGSSDSMLEEKGSSASQESGEAANSKTADAQALLQVIAQKIAQEVGPKLSKGGALRNVLETRMSSFQDKAKNLLMNEMNSTAGEVIRELDAPETMLLLDWNTAVEASFPPIPILIAGAMSPVCINVMTFHHLLQMLTVGLPIMILCFAAIIIDWSSPCDAIPTIFGWLYIQTFLATCLVVGHGVLLCKIISGKGKLAARAQEYAEKSNSGDVTSMREQFVGQTVILQEALLMENEVRGSFWNTIVGAATSAWLVTTVWNLTLIAGWTFIPGVVAFHPKAAKLAPEVYCGSWMTVLVLRINLLLAVLYFFFNLATVIQWICDMMIESRSFQDMVLKQARKMDAGGLPVVELLTKAFVLRGGSDTLDAQLAVVHHHKKVLLQKQASLQSEQCDVQRELERITIAEQALEYKAQRDGGDMASCSAKLSAGGVDFDEWRALGDKAIDEAEMKSRDVQEATTKALEELYERISNMADDAANSETASLLKAKANEAEAAARQGMADAQALAQQAIDKAKDPEFQKMLAEQADTAMQQARSAAEQAKDLSTAAVQTASSAAKEAGMESNSSEQMLQKMKERRAKLEGSG
jgi:hypothetical protein